MKINARVYRSLVSEPIEVQEINGKQVEVHYMNDTKFLSEYIPRGRFYLWTSDGNNYKLLVEKGFYKKLDYFFTQEINTIWIDYLEDVGQTDSKNNRNFMFLTLGITVLAVGIASFFFEELLIWIMIGVFMLSMVINVLQSRRIRDRVRSKNIAAQEKIRELLTEEGFNKLLSDQDEYLKEYFEIADEEETVLLDDTEEVEIIEADEIEIVDEGENE